MNRRQIDIEASEEARMQFVTQRDGMGAALEFARRIMGQYRSALAERNDAGFRAGYGLAYRRELVISCLALRRILRSSKSAGAAPAGHEQHTAIEHQPKVSTE